MEEEMSGRCLALYRSVGDGAWDCREETTHDCGDFIGHACAFTGEADARKQRKCTCLQCSHCESVTASTQAPKRSLATGTRPLEDPVANAWADIAGSPRRGEGAKSLNGIVGGDRSEVGLVVFQRGRQVTKHRR